MKTFSTIARSSIQGQFSIGNIQRNQGSIVTLKTPYHFRLSQGLNENVGLTLDKTFNIFRFERFYPNHMDTDDPNWNIPLGLTLLLSTKLENVNKNTLFNGIIKCPYRSHGGFTPLLSAVYREGRCSWLEAFYQIPTDLPNYLFILSNNKKTNEVAVWIKDGIPSSVPLIELSSELYEEFEVGNPYNWLPRYS